MFAHWKHGAGISCQSSLIGSMVLGFPASVRSLEAWCWDFLPVFAHWKHGAGISCQCSLIGSMVLGFPASVYWHERALNGWCMEALGKPTWYRVDMV